jgi:hypothetical protein
VKVEGLQPTGAERAGIIVGLPARGIEGAVVRNLSVRFKRRLLVRHAEVDARGLTIDPAAGKALIEERGARVRRR